MLKASTIGHFVRFGLLILRTKSRREEEMSLHIVKIERRRIPVVHRTIQLAKIFHRHSSFVLLIPLHFVTRHVFWTFSTASQRRDPFAPDRPTENGSIVDRKHSRRCECLSSRWFDLRQCAHPDDTTSTLHEQKDSRGKTFTHRRRSGKKQRVELFFVLTIRFVRPATLRPERFYNQRTRYASASEMCGLC